MMVMVNKARSAASLMKPALKTQMENIANDLEAAIKALVQSDNITAATEALQDINGLWARANTLHNQVFNRPLAPARKRG